jgi:hypothetical protein
MEYYSALKKNEIRSFAGKWRELEDTVKKNKADTERQILHLFSHMWEHNNNKKTLRAEEEDGTLTY